MVINDVFLHDFPRTSESKTQQFWSCSVISFAGVALNEGPNCGAKQQEAKMLVQYTAFVKLFPSLYEKYFPPSFAEDATLARKKFNMKPTKKGVPTYCNSRLGWETTTIQTLKIF